MNINGYCPHCKADLDGELVIESFMKSGKTREEAIELAGHYSGWQEYKELNRWGRQVGISDIFLDRVTHYKCPDCGGLWK
jgi:hypothetical protein